MVTINRGIWIIAMVFVVVETRFFGSNLFPATPEEIICDGIAAILLALSISSTNS